MNSSTDLNLSISVFNSSKVLGVDGTIEAGTGTGFTSVAIIRAALGLERYSSNDS